MSEKNTHIGIKLLKAVGWLVLGLVVLIGLLRLSLKIAPVHGFVKDKIVSTANQSLNGELSIGELDGDLWNSANLRQITITQQSDTLLTADSLKLEYSIPSLLSSSFLVSEVQLHGLYGWVWETDDEQFNVQQLVKTDTTTPGESSTVFGVDIRNIGLHNSGLSVSAPSYLPDSTLIIEKLQADAGFSYHGEISATLNSLSFDVKQGRLPGAVAVETAGAYDAEHITLYKLVMESTRSMLGADGRLSLPDSSFSANLKTSPLALADIQPFLQQKLPDDELNITLKASGTFDALQVEMQADSRGFEDLQVVADVSFREQPVLHKLGVNAKKLDVAYFTDDSLDAFVGEFQATAEGRFSENFATNDITWDFTFNQLQYQDYRLETLFGSGTLIGEELTASVEANDGTDVVITYTEINGLFSDKPEWGLAVGFERINLAHWAQNPELQSDLTFSVMAEGKGFELSNEEWPFIIYKNNVPRFIDGEKPVVVDKMPQNFADTSSVAGQTLSDVYIQGSISSDSIKADGFVQLIENRVELQAALGQFMSDAPEYTYKIRTKEFDLAELPGLEEYASRIDLQLSGNGRYFEPEKMELETSFLMDSSYVNGTALDLLRFDMSVQEGFLMIPEGELQSNVVDGTFSCRRNLFDRTDPENDLALRLDVKNLQPLAPYVGADALNAEGEITGNITDNEEGELRFNGRVNLSDIYYDDVFRASGILGDTDVALTEIYEFETDVNISSPMFSGTELQDIRFGTRGQATADSVAGSFSFRVNGGESGEIVQNGDYEVATESLNSKVSWSTFNFMTPARMLSLSEPFHLQYDSGAVRTDTLRLSDGEGTFLEFAVPFADSVRQEAYLSGHNFDIGVIQEIIFEERIVDGILSGRFEVSASPHKYEGSGQLKVEQLAYMETNIDTLQLNFDLHEERLKGRLSMYLDGEEKAMGNVDVPFKVGDPATFGDAFFQEKVDGELVIHPISLKRFENILRAFEITNTTGMISFDGSLKGTAGQPNIEGDLNLNEPVLSGVSVDSVFARFRYHHAKASLTGSGEIQARGQKAATLSADIPLYVDFRTFEMNMAEPDDTLRFNLVTDQFNISVFNDFLDKQYMRNLKGMVNADVDITGTPEQLVPSGYFRLNNSEVTVPIAGIRLSNIRADLSFTESGMRLNRLSAKSGSGNFNATGDIELNGITPSSLNINAKATRFKLANTADYNLTIDLDSRLSGTPMQPEASGSLTIKNGFIYLQDFGEESVEVVELEEEETSSFSPYDSLAIDMRFSIERNFFVRNSRYLDMEIELDGSLEAQKSRNQELQLFGTLNGEDGYARPLGKLFELEEASFRFSGPVDRPDLNIRTSYIPQSSQKQGNPIILYYIIEGDAQDPTFRFESEPYMEQQDIICYTIFSKPCYALESWQQVVSGQGGSTPTDLLVDVLLDEVEALATRQLGIDVVQIDNTRSGSGGGTSIKTGWYLNQKTFFAIINEISGSTPETLFILEYMLTKNLDLILTQGDDSRQGIDVRWQYDY
ncbi:translocation/assembly module TamB domain-containing protein [Gracilimonas mengyeensis]|uniref:Translocation and assembly module TamB C-terminal domain-containing protein n=1 Tax=Gracilimonas mengyeensis TaxID=1302730 RepID=A0A521BYG3_9BACT|nr:translocation/assembly module TamB domain-containing protein [Gracilimonas mengyeensis]SMO51530.1 Family of unknown function [Gracilimonas mengyeensis]